MRKLIVALTLTAGSYYAAEAQKAYIRLGFGYGVPQAGQTRDIDGYPFNGSATHSSTAGFTAVNMKKTSLAAGYTCTVAIGTMVNENIGIELASIVGIAPQKNKGNYDISTATYTGTVKYTMYAKNPIMLVPSVVLQTGKKARFYMRAGVILPINTKIVDEYAENVTDQTGSHSVNGKAEVHSYFKFGISGAMGLNVTMVKGVRFYIESALQSMSLYLKEEDITAYNVDGQNVLQYVDRTTRYKSKVSGSADQGTYSLPFSSLGGNAGFVFEL